MTRWVGAALLLAGSSALGGWAVAQLRGRVRDLQGLTAGLEAMARALSTSLAPLDQMLQEAETCAKPLPSASRIRMNGHIKGYVNGVLEGDFIGVIDGEMGAVVRPKDTVTMEREDAAENVYPRLEAQELSNNTAESEGTEDEQ